MADVSAVPFPQWVGRTSTRCWVSALIHPAQGATARKYKGVRPVTVDDREFKVTIEGGVRHRLPVIAVEWHGGDNRSMTWINSRGRHACMKPTVLRTEYA